MITVQLQEKDYLAAVRLHRRTSKMTLLTIGSALCYAVAGLAMLVFAPDELVFWAYFLFGMGAFLILFLIWMHYMEVPRSVRRRFLQQKDLSRQYTISWNDEKLTIDGEDLHAGILWTDFLKWLEDDQLFLIYSGRILFRIIPKRTFPDQGAAADFSRMLSQKIGPKGKARK